MKILELTMSAFGPFADKQYIDFSQFGGSGILLIHGNTGSGKTTIFDAISYAIYGETSSADRNAKSMICNNAKDGVETYVKLKFEYAGQKYTVTRHPQYTKINTKGNETNVPEKVVLEFEDGSYLEKRDANKKLESIMGIDKQQFAQIALLAQGKFTEIIKASTTQREEIFRKIFNTSKYDEFDKILNKKSNEQKNKLDYLQTEYSKDIDNLVINDKNLVNLSGKENIANAKDTISIVESAIKSDLDQSKINNDNKAKFEQQLIELENNIQETKRLYGIKQSLEETNLKLEENKKQLVEAEYKLELAKQKEIDIAKIIGILEVLNSQIPEYENIEKREKEIKNEESKYFNKIKELSDKKTNKEKLEKEILNLKSELTKLMTADSELVKYENKSKELEKALEKLKELYNLFFEYEKLKKSYFEKDKNYNDISKQYTDIENEYNDMQKAYIEGYSYTLAKELETGKPCPVCGSCEHPKIASRIIAPPSIKEIETKQKELEKIKANKERSEKIKKYEFDKCTACSITLFEIYKEYFTEKLDRDNFKQNSANVDKLLKSKDKEYSDIESKIKISKNNVERKNYLLEIIPKNEDKLKYLSSEILDIETDTSARKSKIESESANLNEQKNKLSYKSLEELNNAINEKQKNKEMFEKNIKDAQENKDKKNNESIKLNTEKRNFEKELDGKTIPDINELNKEKEELNKNKKDSEETLKTLNISINNNKKILENIEKNLKEYNKVSNEHEVLLQLINCSGSNSMSLETFVQIGYFDNILKFANVHYEKFNGGAYSFIRETRSQDGRKSFGLNLDVVDYSNNTIRSVNTLSGGESFNAAMSLALGLSEAVQSSAGGIQIDSVFIDEGFGTLDKESLDRAIKTIMQITTNNRMVYVISHVEELKQSIDKQIIVHKKANNSEIEVIV